MRLSEITSIVADKANVKEPFVEGYVLMAMKVEHGVNPDQAREYDYSAADVDQLVTALRRYKRADQLGFDQVEDVRAIKAELDEVSHESDALLMRKAMLETELTNMTTLAVHAGARIRTLCDITGSSYAQLNSRMKDDVDMAVVESYKRRVAQDEVGGSPVEASDIPVVIVDHNEDEDVDLGDFEPEEHDLVAGVPQPVVARGVEDLMDPEGNPDYKPGQRIVSDEVPF